ncbi:MAG: hypothetical protein GOVbin3009_52 [Prokaryotic dsDNA virus sp.]|jgi:hypothetical protein|nr:MAG: hypothetical protein GOVbin3009_52 [Prokaryotic dsDNA virus sp.]|tara:strand:+ start:6253 stop:6636 length:384 start_codon:yes stop_codon:yes gene_type:complete
MYNHSLYTLWDDAVNDRKSVNLSSGNEEAYIYKGIKIVNTNGDIKIYNTRKLGMTYKEISDDDYYLFLTHGFRKGVHEVMKHTYKEQIEKINSKIHGEVNNRNNKKHYEALKQRRESLLNKYSNLNK